jgi:photosystem II stability/assembly factor-like uncharacterized protein
MFALAATPLAERPAEIAFWTPRRGLLTRGTTVSLTTDAGRTFRVVLRTHRHILRLQAFGGRNAIVDLDHADSLRTLDGGHSWSRFRHRFSADFASARTGLGFRTGRYELVRSFVLTRDGGKTWQRTSDPCTRAVASRVYVDLVTPRLGWVVCVGQGGAGNEEKAVFRTADGGDTWRPGAEMVVVPRLRARGGLGSYGYPQGIAFARDGFGLLWESRGTLYVTRDAGLNWTAKPKVAQPELDFGGGAAAFARGRGLVLLGRGDGAARLLATHDYGRSWVLVHRWPALTGG